MTAKKSKPNPKDHRVIASRYQELYQRQESVIKNLTDRLEETADSLKMSLETINRFDHENKELKKQIEILEKREQFERGRMSQALETAESAAMAAGSIGRLTLSLGMTLETLQVTVENLNKEANKRLR